MTSDPGVLCRVEAGCRPPGLHLWGCRLHWASFPLRSYSPLNTLRPGGSGPSLPPLCTATVQVVSCGSSEQVPSLLASGGLGRPATAPRSWPLHSDQLPDWHQVAHCILQ